MIIHKIKFTCPHCRGRILDIAIMTLVRMPEATLTTDWKNIHVSAPLETLEIDKERSVILSCTCRQCCGTWTSLEVLAACDALRDHAGYPVDECGQRKLTNP